MPYRFALLAVGLVLISGCTDRNETTGISVVSAPQAQAVTLTIPSDRGDCTNLCLVHLSTSAGAELLVDTADSFIGLPENSVLINSDTTVMELAAGIRVAAQDVAWAFQPVESGSAPLPDDCGGLWCSVTFTAPAGWAGFMLTPTPFELREVAGNGEWTVISNEPIVVSYLSAGGDTTLRRATSEVAHVNSFAVKVAGADCGIACTLSFDAPTDLQSYQYHWKALDSKRHGQGARPADGFTSGATIGVPLPLAEQDALLTLELVTDTELDISAMLPPRVTPWPTATISGQHAGSAPLTITASDDCALAVHAPHEQTAYQPDGLVSSLQLAGPSGTWTITYAWDPDGPEPTVTTT